MAGFQGLLPAPWVDNGIENDPPVHVFVMGANTWRAEQDWPLPGGEFFEQAHFVQDFLQIGVMSLHSDDLGEKDKVKLLHSETTFIVDGVNRVPSQSL